MTSAGGLDTAEVRVNEAGWRGPATTGALVFAVPSLVFPAVPCQERMVLRQRSRAGGSVGGSEGGGAGVPCMGFWTRVTLHAKKERMVPGSLLVPVACLRSCQARGAPRGAASRSQVESHPMEHLRRCSCMHRSGARQPRLHAVACTVVEQGIHGARMPLPQRCLPPARVCACARRHTCCLLARCPPTS
jgi:hypothetical protein